MTTVSEAFPSNYLKAADLKNRRVKVAIDKVVFEEIGQNKDSKPIVYFNKVEKGLVLNKTNAVEIAATHGEEMAGWTGKEIELFQQMVPFQGQNVPAIRIRAVAETTADEELNAPLGI
jgi:hypothetical protein